MSDTDSMIEVEQPFDIRLPLEELTRKSRRGR
ncbi:hypothetical protein J2S44_001725 [Catenuloplanes niger]|uniref:Uncharacterized protein n=1 Tax=Catenuloplanes niger TaxID=587534 RepID=A0AAE4CQY6_9ACTN|nr:hypothetical protein [Catenuloplanes niger]